MMELQHFVFHIVNQFCVIRNVFMFVTDVYINKEAGKIIIANFWRKVILNKRALLPTPSGYVN